MNIKKNPFPVSRIAAAACLGLALLAATPSVLAQATNWIWTGDTSSDWNTADNWDPESVPNSNTTGNTVTIALDGANVTMSAAGTARDLTVSGNGTAAPVLNITQNLTNSFSRVHVGSSATGTGFGGTVNHTAGTFLIGGSGNMDLYIAHRLDANNLSANNTGTYNFGGASATAPTLDIGRDLAIARRDGENGTLSMSGHGTVKVANQLVMSRFGGTSELRIEGGNLDINVADDMVFRGAGTSFATLRAVIDDTGFSTINVGGNMFFHPANPARSDFELELGAGYTHVLNTVYTIIDAEGLFQYREGSTITADGRFGNVADNDILTVGGNEFRANYVTGDGTQFTITAIPEPSSVALVLVAGLAAFVLRKRQGA